MIGQNARVWLMPAAVGAVSAIGLITALISEGAGDLVGWLALGVPVAVCGHALARNLRPARARRRRR